MNQSARRGPEKAVSIYTRVRTCDPNVPLIVAVQSSKSRGKSLITVQTAPMWRPTWSHLMKPLWQDLRVKIQEIKRNPDWYAPQHRRMLDDGGREERRGLAKRRWPVVEGVKDETACARRNDADSRFYVI